MRAAWIRRRESPSFVSTLQVPRLRMLRWSSRFMDDSLIIATPWSRYLFRSTIVQCRKLLYCFSWSLALASHILFSKFTWMLCATAAVKYERKTAPGILPAASCILDRFQLGWQEVKMSIRFVPITCRCPVLPESVQLNIWSLWSVLNWLAIRSFWAPPNPMVYHHDHILGRIFRT